MITLSDREQLLLQAAITNLSVPDLASVIDFDRVAIITGHANKGVARTMFKRMMVKIESGDQPTKNPTPTKSKKRKADDMVDKNDKQNGKGTKQSRAKAQPFAEEELDDDSEDVKPKIKRERQPDTLEFE